ncbi:MAG: DUF1517 domain-containing protein [Proteobacteria bacterium]|nr:DUF1517 domain-containing protein [Pseudomonadota bacterium]
MARRLVFVLLLLAFGGVAVADTGGRIGGGSWGGGGGGGHSYTPSYSYSSSSSSHDYGHTSYSYSHYSHGDGLPWWVYLILIGGGIIVQIVKSSASNDNLSYSPSTSYSNYGGGYTTADAVDVSVLRIAIDGRARKFVQAELARIAKAADTTTQEGRATTLREVAMMLRRLRDAWIYGGAVNEQMTHRNNAKQIFDRHVDATRARFKHETVANVQGQITTTAGGDYIPRAAEGEGVILITLVIAARTELFTVLKIGDGEDLRKALESAGSRTANDIVAMEIIWQPSEDADRMSSIELELKYPHPQVIKIQNALAGKTFCAYCTGPFPAELVSCPHCGAPARDAA